MVRLLVKAIFKSTSSKDALSTQSLLLPKVRFVLDARTIEGNTLLFTGLPPDITFDIFRQAEPDCPEIDVSAVVSVDVVGTRVNPPKAGKAPKANKGPKARRM